MSRHDHRMSIDARRTAVLALHWQVNVIKPEGFFGSRLAEPGIDTVLITGVATNLTVEQTARHGTDLGLTVHVISDCVTAASEDTHLASLASLDLATAGCRHAEEILH